MDQLFLCVVFGLAMFKLWALDGSKVLNDMNLIQRDTFCDWVLDVRHSTVDKLVLDYLEFPEDFLDLEKNLFDRFGLTGYL